MPLFGSQPQHRRDLLHRQRRGVQQAADLARPAPGMEIAAGQSLRITTAVFRQSQQRAVGHLLQVFQRRPRSPATTARSGRWSRQPVFAHARRDPETIAVTRGQLAAAYAGASFQNSRISTSPKPSSPSRFGFVRMVLTSPKRSELAARQSEGAIRSFRSQRVFAARMRFRRLRSARRQTTPTSSCRTNRTRRCSSSLSLDYSATSAIRPGDVPQAPDTFLIVGPFGAARAAYECARASGAGRSTGQAALFLGIEHLTAPANLSLLFQIDVGTASSARRC